MTASTSFRAVVTLPPKKTDQGHFALRSIRFDDIIPRCAAGVARTVVVERPHVGKAPNNILRRRSFPEVSFDLVTEMAISPTSIDGGRQSTVNATSMVTSVVPTIVNRSSNGMVKTSRPSGDWRLWHAPRHRAAAQRCGCRVAAESLSRYFGRRHSRGRTRPAPVAVTASTCVSSISSIPL